MCEKPFFLFLPFPFSYIRGRATSSIQSALALKANILPLQTNLTRELVLFAGSTVSVKAEWHSTCAKKYSISQARSVESLVFQAVGLCMQV